MNASEDPELRRVVRFWDARAREDARRYSVPGGTRVDDATFDGAGDAVLAALSRDLGWSVDGAADVLDLGCGAGRITGALASRAREVLAVDVSAGMLEAARSRHADAKNITWATGDACDLERTAPSSVDAVLALGLLTHLPTVKLVAAALEEIGRVLRPDGTAAFDVRTAAPPPVLPGEHDLPPHVLGHPLWHGVAVDLETLAALAQNAELVLERIEGSGTARGLVLARREAF